MTYTVVPTKATGDVLAAADWNTYIRDNLAALRDGSGLAAGAVAAAALASGAVTSAAIADGTIAAADLAAGAVTPVKLDIDNILPWLIDITPLPSAHGNTSWSTLTQSASIVYAGVKQSAGTINNEIYWDVVIPAGTWTFELMHWKSTNRGIYTVYFDASSKGTIDGYAATAADSVLSQITGIVVTVTAKVRLKLTMGTKNASASAYGGYIQHIRLLRTA